MTDEMRIHHIDSAILLLHSIKRALAADFFSLCSIAPLSNRVFALLRILLGNCCSTLRLWRLLPVNTALTNDASFDYARQSTRFDKSLLR